MTKRKKLGQHFLTSTKIAKLIQNKAKITKNDVVLEIGTGKGILLPYLCTKAKKVISIEIDKSFFNQIKSKFKFDNLEIKNADGFKTNTKFSIFVSNLPYSQSKHALEWLMQKKFSRAIIMVQKEFEEKITLSKKRKAITILANYAFDIEHISNVGRNNFSPPPNIDSSILQIKQKHIVSNELIKTVNKLFSYRRKTIQNIMKQVGKNIESDERLDDLTGDEIIKLAKQIIKQ